MEQILPGPKNWETTFTPHEESVWSVEKRRALYVLQDNGYLTFEPDDSVEGGRRIVCDLEKFKYGTNWHKLRSELGRLAITSDGRKKTKLQVFADIFQDLDVVSMEGRSDQPRKLFYIPENDASALDMEKIKASEPCYLGFWQISSMTTDHPLRAESVDDRVKPADMCIAAMIYHPSFGAGERGIDGVLRVRYPDGEVKPINSSFFRYHRVGARRYNFSSAMANSPRTYLEERGFDLLEKDILRITDFRTQSGGADGRFRIVGRRVRRNGLLTLAGNTILVGPKFAAPEYSVTQLSPELAVLINSGSGNNVIEEVIVLPEADVKNRYFGNQGWSRYGLGDFMHQFPTHSSVVEHFGEYLSFSNRLNNEYQINLASMSIREQSMVWLVFRDFGQNQSFWEFLDNQGSDGLHALMVAEDSLPNASLVLEIGKHPQAGFLFENLSAILRTVGSTEALIRRQPSTAQFNPEQISIVSDMIIKHAGKLFLSAYEVGSMDLGASMQDVTHTLYRYRKQVENWYQNTFLRGNFESNHYLRLLRVFDQTKEGSNVQTLLLEMIQQYWEQDVLREAKKPENQALVRTLEQIRRFYVDNKELFESASTTTGDTNAERAALAKFFSSLDSISGIVVDLACGNRDRLTNFMAEMLEGRAKVYGLDLWTPGKNIQPNLEIIQASIGAMPFPDHSVAVATLNWSPPNDWVPRISQIVNFKELSRVMMPGGVIRADVAYLEGGKNSWLSAVESQYAAGAEKYGDVKIEFPGERQGEFHIYPLSELKAHLSTAGFGEIQTDVWRTKAGKPRITITAKYQGKSNPL